MKNNITTLAIIAIAMLMTACGSLKKAAPTLPETDNTGQTTTTTTETVDPTEAIIATLGNWQTLQTGGNISLKTSSSFSSSIQVRMVRNQAIYISLRPVLGIEVGRLLITGDSLYVVDKVHRRYIAEKVSLLTAGIPVTVSDVQDIFLGRPFVIGKGTLNQALKDQMTTTTQGKTVTMTANEQYHGHGYAFEFDSSKRIVSLDIVPEGSTTAAYQVKYSDVRGTTAGNVAHSVMVNASVKKRKLDFTLTYKDINWNEKVNIDQKIPGNYSRVSASDILSLFSN